MADSLPLPEQYLGDEDYIFVSYAHEDIGKVAPFIDHLNSKGFHVWYDRYGQGYESEQEWPVEVAKRLNGCRCFLAMLTRVYLDKPNCRREINAAAKLIDNSRRIGLVLAYLEDVNLHDSDEGRAIEFMIGGFSNKTYRENWGSDEDFYKAVTRKKALASCREGSKPISYGNGKEETNPTEEAKPNGTWNWDDEIETPPPRESIEKYGWDELKRISLAISAAESNDAGMVIARRYRLVNAQFRLEGDTKSVWIGGQKHFVRIAGFRHDDLADKSGKAGITFEFADVLGTHEVNCERRFGNKGGWETSEMRQWLKDSLFEALPEELRTRIVEVKKRTNNYGQVDAEDDVHEVTALPDRIWLLSMCEVFGERIACSDGSKLSLLSIYQAEGTQYQLYGDRRVSRVGDTSRRKKKGGVHAVWWLRSPYVQSSFGFCIVQKDGSWYADSADQNWGVSPGFCI